MNINTLDQDEHEKFFFGYSSTEVYYSLESTITKCIDAFLSECQSTLEESGTVNKDIIKEQIESLKYLYKSKCLKVLEEFKVVLKNIFSIPENADIYDMKTRSSCTEEEVLLLRKEVAELEHVFLREKLFLEMLKVEKQVLDKLKPVTLEAKTMLSKLRNESEGGELQEMNKLLNRHQKYSAKLEMPLDNSK